MKGKVLLVMVLTLVLGMVQAQRFYMETGVTDLVLPAGGTGANLGFVFANQTNFGMNVQLSGGVRDLAGPFGVGGNLGIILMGGSAVFNLGLDGLFHFGKAGVAPLAGFGFRVFFGGGQTLFGLGAAGGVEYFLNKNASAVIVAKPTLLFAGQAVFGVNLGVGLRVYP